MPRRNGAVKPLRTHKKYPVPNAHPPRCAGWGYFNQGLFRSTRSSNGRRYGNDELAILESIIDEIERDGLSRVEIVIDYNTMKKSICYGTTVATLRAHGRRVLGVSGPELAMDRCLWSIDGAEPTGPVDARELTIEQMSLF
ncbi:MAG: hypothetical protein R3C14_28710 [Caldilineaceae bacterium]